MKPLTWTKKKPTKEGYYWVRLYSDESTYIEFFYESGPFIKDNHDDYEYAGPIPEPKDK